MFRSYRYSEINLHLEVSFRTLILVLLFLHLPSSIAVAEHLNGQVSEVESLPSNNSQDTTPPANNNQLPSWFGNENLSSRASTTVPSSSNSLPTWFGRPSIIKPSRITVLPPPDQATEDATPSTTGKQFSGEVQKQESSGNTSYTEIINDGHGMRTIDWNKWVDKFNRRFINLVNHTPEFQFWFQNRSNAEADFTFTVNRYGNIAFTPEYCNNQLLQSCAEKAILEMEYKKYLEFPEGSQRAEFIFKSGVIAHRGPFPHARGYEEQVNY